ncbi:MAG: hypothetical protein RL757_2128 [Bacteroidota bacterium]
MLAVSLAAMLSSCSQPKTVDLEKEKATILESLTKESRSFYGRDYANWEKFYVHSPKTQFVCVEPDVTLRAVGWDDLSKFIGTYIKENPQPIDYNKANYTRKDIAFSLEGNMAFVSWSGTNIQPDGSLRSLIEYRTMLKENGEWRILSMVSYPSDNPKGSTPNVYLHKGTVN